MDYESSFGMTIRCFSQDSLQRNRADRIYRVVCKRKFNLGTSFHNYGGWEFPWSVINNLKNQESQGSTQSESHGLQKGGKGKMISIQSLLEPESPRNRSTLVPRSGEDGCLSSSRESRLALLPVFVLFRHRADCMTPTYVGGSNPL